MPTKMNSVHFQLNSGNLTIDKKALEEIKLAMQVYVEGPGFPTKLMEIRESIRAELKSSSIWINDDQAGIGSWKIESRDGCLAAVRYPQPRQGTMYLYIAFLEVTNSGWKVVYFEQEREMGPV